MQAHRIRTPLAATRLLALLVPIFISANGASAQTVTLPAPTIFEPGIISGPASDGAPTFSPDGHTLYLERGNNTWDVILEAHQQDRRWSKPAIAPFSGPSSDQQPCLSPDGRYLIYESSRFKPADAQRGTPAELIAHLWRVDKQGSG